MRKFTQYLSLQEQVELHEELVLEAKAKKEHGGAGTQNSAGVLHEILVGKHLNGDKGEDNRHMAKHPDVNGKSPKEVHDEMRSQLTPEHYNAINEKAKHAANDIRKKLGKHGKISRVQWTSKSGDLHRATGIHATQREDASDIVATTTHPKTGKVTHHGISLKVSEGPKSTHVPLANRGAEATLGGDHIIKAHKERIEAEHPELKNLPHDPDQKDNSAKTKRKRWAKTHPEHAEAIKKKNTETIRKLASHTANSLTQEGGHAIEKHLRDHVLSAHPTPMEKEGHTHIRHTTYGNGDTEHYTPSTHFDDKLKDHPNLTAHHVGNGIVFHHKGKPFARQTFKTDSNSDPTASFKSIGNTTGSKKSTH